jgi:hypothetical protein
VEADGIKKGGGETEEEEEAFVGVCVRLSFVRSVPVF